MFIRLLLLLLHLLSDEILVECNNFFYDLSPHPDYRMSWRFDDEEITIRVTANTTGWISWGLSTSDDLGNADGVIGWVEGGKTPRFYDVHYNVHKKPSIDEQQDYELINMWEAGNKTSMTFKRKLQTSDKADLPITTGTARIQWAWGRTDLDNFLGTSSPAKRGVAYTFLIDYAYRNNKLLPKHYKTFDIRMNEYKVPTKLYQEPILILKFPDENIKQHIIRIEPLITEGNEHMIHHMKVYQSVSSLVPVNSIGKVITNSEVNAYGKLITIYAANSGTVDYPAETGMSIQRDVGSDSVLLALEIHYHRTTPGMIDSSGFRLYYTDKLRKYDTSIVLFGNYYGSNTIIPPQQHNFTTYAFFPSQLLQRISTRVDEKFPTIFALALHGHTYTTKIVVRLVDEKTGKEKQIIMEEPNFQFSYQRPHFLKQPIAIPPNHRIVIECTRNTMRRQTPLLEGDSTRNEMCEAFIGIYPKLTAWICESYSSNAATWGHRHLGWKTKSKWMKNRLMKYSTLLSPVNVNGRIYVNVSTIEPLLNAEFWLGKESRVRSFEKDGATEPYTYQCINDDESLILGGPVRNKP